MSIRFAPQPWSPSSSSSSGRAGRARPPADRRLRRAASPRLRQPAASQAAASFAPASLRWYCCLGTGEDPVQIFVEEEVAAGFGEKHAGSSLKFEVVTYDQARNTLSTQIASGNGPDIGPVGGRPGRLGGPVARPEPTHRLHRLRHEPVRRGSRRVLQHRRRPDRLAVRGLSVDALVQGRPLRGGRAGATAARVRRQVHDARTAARSTGPTTRSRRS